MASPLGIKIRQLRKKDNLTLDKLAELTDSSKSYIWELENKDDVNPTGEKLYKLAKALKTSVEFFLDNNKDEPSINDKKIAFFRRYEDLTLDKKRALNAFLNALDDEPES